MRPLAILAFAAVASGCSLDPAYHRPASPVSATFPQGESYAPAAQDPAAADFAWRHVFIDAKLRRVIELALAQSRDLRAALAAAQASRAQVIVQRAALFPSINATGGEAYQRTPSGAGASASAGGAPFDIRTYSADVGLSSWQIDLFGRTRSLTRAAAEQYLADEDNRRAVRTTVIAETATDWFTLAADRELLALAKRTLAAQQASLDLTRSRVDAGVASQLDLEQALSTVQQARADVAQFTTQAAQARNALELAAGAPIPEDLLPTGLGEGSGLIQPLQAGASSAVLLQRPDVLQAEHRLKSANANIGAARAAFFPTISLTAQAGQESPTLQRLFDAASRTWLFQPSLSQPLFQGGRNIGGLRAAKAQRDQAQAQYEKAIQTAFREVADALARAGTIDEQLAAQQALVEADASSLELSTARYERGADAYLNVLVAQRALYAAQQSQVSTRLAGLANAVALYQALGGGQI